MRLLIHDVFHHPSADITLGDPSIITPALQDTTTDQSFTIEFDDHEVNCIAVGNVFAGTYPPQ